MPSAFSFVVLPEGGVAGESLLRCNLPGKVSLKSFCGDDRIFSLK